MKLFTIVVAWSLSLHGPHREYQALVMATDHATCLEAGALYLDEVDKRLKYWRGKIGIDEIPTSVHRVDVKCHAFNPEIKR